MKKWFCTIASVFILTACQPPTKNDNTIRVGTIAGPETGLMEVAKKVAKEKFNLNIKIVAFNDYLQPHSAVVEGSIDANMTAHQPYLDAVIQSHHYDLTAVADTFVYPMGIYSKKITSLTQLKNNAMIGVPNDPTNEGRALLLLQQAKLIELKQGSGLTATVNDITSNPKQLIFKELDAAFLPRSLNDVALAVINTNYAISAGLFPAKDALFIENENSPYVDVIVVKTANVNDARVKQLVEAFQSQEVVDEADRLFPGGAAVVGWNIKN